MRLTKTTTIIISLLFFIFCFTTYLQNKNFTERKKTARSMQAFIVTRVIDGDTFVIDTGQKVRLLGVDTPELHHPLKPVQCYAKEAMLQTKALIENKMVRLIKDTGDKDKYHRLLRYVYVVDDTKHSSSFFLNAYLVEKGFARLLIIPPNTHYQSLFQHLQQLAIHQHIGLWRYCPNLIQ